MTNPFSCLVGQILKEFKLSRDGTKLMITTDTHLHRFETEGYRCNVYIIPPDSRDVRNALGRLVVRVAAREHTREALGRHEVVDTAFYDISAGMGDISLELRAEHSGYYHGEIKHLTSEALT